MEEFTPVIVSTYARADKLEQTLLSLNNCKNAQCFDVYVYSDGPKTGDEGRVRAVRNMLAKFMPNFKTFKVVSREANYGLIQNRMAMIEILNKYGRLIFLEEDNIVAPGFLNFMNEGLEFYKDNLEVVSLCGYTKDYKSLPLVKGDSYGIKRFSAWGFAIWRRSFVPTMRPERFLSLWQLKSKLDELGEDIFYMSRKLKAGKLDALDLRVILLQNITDQYTIYPRKSLVQNIGHDGSGLHCKDTLKFEVGKLWEKETDFIFNTAIDEVSNIKKDIRKFRKVRLASKIKSHVLYSSSLNTLMRILSKNSSK
jgi:hypothetical protein